MSIPKYNSYGFIPIGAHPTTLEVLDTEIAKMDRRRIEIWTKFKECESQTRTSRLFNNLFFFGSFFSTKLDPSDIDVALQFNENNKPGDSDLWIFDQESVRQKYLTDVVFIEPSSASFKNLLPANLKCSSANLTMCRVLSPKQEMEWATKLKVFPQDLHGKEYKGVLVVRIKIGMKRDWSSCNYVTQGNVTAPEPNTEQQQT
jgi:hypothetical protein